MTGIPTVSESAFDDAVLRHGEAVVVDFFATWCGPCHVLESALDQVARRHPGVRFVRVDVDEAPGLVERFGIRAIPTVIRFDAGIATARALGAMTPDAVACRLHLSDDGGEPRRRRRALWTKRRPPPV